MSASANKNNTRKGSAYEDAIRKYLESLGYTVDKARATRKQLFGPRGPIRDKKGNPVYVSSRNDFFGCVDLIALHPQKSYTLFIQATKDRGVSRKQSKLETVDWNLRHHRVQVWMPSAGGPGTTAVHILTGLPHAIGNTQEAAIWQKVVIKRRKGVPCQEMVL